MSAKMTNQEYAYAAIAFGIAFGMNQFHTTRMSSLLKGISFAS